MGSPKKQPRSAKRFSYNVPAQLTMGNEMDEARITNISASGIQFETNSPTRLKSRIQLLWSDETLGILGPTMFVVREIRKPERKNFQYIYGAQYHQLQSELKNKLVLLLRRLREQENQEAFEKMQAASPEYLMDVVDQGILFLKVSIHEKAPPLPALVKAMEHLAEYEKNAFQINDTNSIQIQHFATSTFQCKVLTYLIPVVLNRLDLKKKFISCVTSAISSMHDLNKIGQQSRDPRISESANRTFYAKQELLQVVSEVFDQFQDPSPQHQASLKVITSEYEESLEISKDSAFDFQGLGRTKMGNLPRLVQDEVIIDNRPVHEEASMYWIAVGLFIAIFLGVLFFVMMNG